jgi:two-component system sensor histidine kinase KdpD
MDGSRRKPEEILAKLKKEERSALEGKLKIFLGAAPGVGKTYAMLEEAHKLKRRA